MKKLNFILGLGLAALFFSCSDTQKNANKSTENSETIAETLVNENGGAIHLTKESFIDKIWDFESSPDKWVYKGDKPCIIDFYADWCGPCKIAAPILEELAIEFKEDIYVYKIDTEKERELAAAFGIRNIPAFLYCPVEGDPQMAAGIGRTPEQTKEMFVNVIKEFLLVKN